MTVLIIRFSALGDVALLSPVVYCVLAQNPELQIQVLTRQNFKALFPIHPRLQFLGVDFKGVHQGIRGILRMRKEILANSPDIIIDEHDVLRSVLLRGLLSVSGLPCKVFPKGRKEKNAWISRREKKEIPKLLHATERYASPFRSLNLSVSIEKQLLPSYGVSSEKLALFIEKLPKDCPLIGLAPLAKHPSKIWGLKRIYQCMQYIWERQPATHFYLFGGNDERDDLQSILLDKDKTHLLAGEFTLAEELTLMRHMKVMLCMDSGNMHLSVLAGVPVVSVWGGTHPNLGFSPLFNEHNIIQAELPCRPATVYGKITKKWQRSCYQAAFEQISPSIVAEKLLQYS